MTAEQVLELSLMLYKPLYCHWWVMCVICTEEFTRIRYDCCVCMHTQARQLNISFAYQAHNSLDYCNEGANWLSSLHSR